MSVGEAIFLGVVQGLTEFLPVSSSGHLVLAEKIMGREADLFFNITLHVGTLLALFTVFKRTFFDILKHPLKDKRTSMTVVASIPTALIAFAVKIFVPDDVYYGLLPLGFTLTAVLLYVTRLFKCEKNMYTNKPFLIAFAAGTAQGLAVFSGLSRSGATIAAMSAFGVKREQSAEFSFLISVPVIIGGALWEVLKAAQSNTQIEWIPAVVGAVVAYFVGVICLRFLLGLLKSKDLHRFAYYMIIPILLSLLTL